VKGLCFAFGFCLAGGCLRVLVTGGAGFIGSHTVDRLLAEDLDVIVLDSLRSGSLENISHHFGEKGFRFVRGDIRMLMLWRIWLAVLITLFIWQL
jgi:nucleoside-diphosphate-sugar epimerase